MSLSVQASGAGEQLDGVHQVRCAPLVDPDLDLREAPQQRAGRTRMVEVDVGEREHPRRLAAERLQQRLQAGGRARIDDHVAHRQAPITRSRPRWRRSIRLISWLAGSLSGRSEAFRSPTEPYNCPHEPQINPARRPATGGDASHRLPERDHPWMMRTYAGHSTAAASNELYRRNLSKGQTGLSVAFDLPTQTGYDPDDELARGEVGKVGVPVSHRGDMATLMDGIPLDQMNTSMTINATAAWLLALYIVAAEEQGVAEDSLQGTTQNDIIKEFLARGTYAFPPAPSMRLIADMIAYTVEHVPRWNPINICSYHLQEAGRHPRAGDRLRDEQRDRGPRRGARARAAPSAWARCSDASRSSSTPACASSRSTPSCARCRSCGSRSAASATRSRTRGTCAFATASRSTRSGSPSPSPRTTFSGSCSRPWR